MMNAYDEMYVDGAMQRMGDMMEYAVLDLGMDPDAFFKMFVDSSLSRKFEVGNVSVVAGMSGPEIAERVLEEIEHIRRDIRPEWREDRSDVFWAGWVLAFYQWMSNQSFKMIWDDVSIEKLRSMYPTLHEADVMKAVEVLKRMQTRSDRSRSISELRILRGWTQAQLAEAAGMTVSQLQRLEYGERKTENLRLKTALALAKALGVSVEEI